MKALHVVEATTAGVGRHVLDLARFQRGAGLDVTVACPRVRREARRDVDFVARLEAADVPVAIVPMRRSIHPLADLLACATLARLIDRGGYDVVHAHSSKAGVLGRLAACRAGVPAVVYTPNAFAFPGARNRAGFCLYRASERWLGHHATGVLVCVSASELALAQRESIAPPGRLVLIENAIDVEPFVAAQDRVAAKTALGLEAAQPLVGFVGRLAAQKGVDCFLEAARLALTSGTKAQFILVGEGELEGAVRRLIRRHRLEGRVILAGYRADVPQVMAALDLFVLPSRYEGLSYTLMEAMAAGRPVIATDVPGNRDLVRHRETGLLVPPGDALALAEAVLRLLANHDERRRLGQAAQAAALARSTPEEMARQVIALYKSQLDRSGTPELVRVM